MKQRTIEELHDKDIGHRKFAKVVDLLIKNHYQITDIKEYNEKFKFNVNGYEFVYSKNWKSSAKSYCEYLIDILRRFKK